MFFPVFFTMASRTSHASVLSAATGATVDVDDLWSGNALSNYSCGPAGAMAGGGHSVARMSHRVDVGWLMVGGLWKQYLFGFLHTRQ